ncbi:MAG: hypothetical protein K8F30_11920, partial [Taibaiella sp.]|nr:hypothetical protein [Taibaiella sp.]
MIGVLSAVVVPVSSAIAPTLMLSAKNIPAAMTSRFFIFCFHFRLLFSIAHASYCIKPHKKTTSAIAVGGTGYLS